MRGFLIFLGLALVLPVYAGEPKDVVLAWELVRGDQEVDGYEYARVSMSGLYHYGNLVPHKYNKDAVQAGNKVRAIRGEVFSGVELSLKPKWVGGVVVDYNVVQSSLEGFEKIPGGLLIEIPDQKRYEARGSSQPLAIGDVELVRLGCNKDVAVQQCPYYMKITVKQLN